MKVKSCRLCLAVEVKVFKLGNTAAKRFIEFLFKENGFSQGLCESHYICYVCKALLDKSHNFIQRIIAAQQILNNMLKVNKKITSSTLKEIERQRISPSSSLVIHDVNIIDIFPDDYDEKYLSETEYSDMLVDSNKKEDYFDTFESNSPIDNLITINQFENIYEEEPIECINPTSVKRKKKNDNNEFDPTFSTKKQKKSRKKNIRSKTQKRTDLDIGNVSGKVPVKKKYSKKLEPSKFILSLSNVGDKSERRKKQYKFKEYDYNSDTDKIDTDTIYQPQVTQDEYQPDSSGESTDSDYEMYDDNGKKMKKPKREYPRKCDHCDYEVPVATVHYKHYMIVHPEKPYPYCALSTKFVCQFCGKISKRKSRLDNHELTHSKKNCFKCSQCPKTFCNGVRLYRHVTITHTKKFLECDYCSKKFKTRVDIGRHIRIHTGEKPFKCHICGAGFAHKGNVGIHIRSNHEQLKDEKKKTRSKRKRERKDSSDDSLINLLQLKETKNKKE